MEEEENKDLQYLLEAKNEKRRLINRILIIVAIIFTVIITAVIAGLLLAKSHNEKLLAEYMAKEEAKNQEKIEEEKKPSLPVYSENARNRMQNIYVEEGEEKVVYLTFDDGPSSNITPQILQILESENVKATFFVLGSRAELYPELVKQEYETGHYIANHGYSHNYKAIYSSPNAVLDEYNRTEEIIRQAIGKENYSSYLFRFPGGSSGGKYAKVKNAAIELLDQNNVAHINWNSLTSDAVGTPTQESIVSSLISTAEGKNRVVVLMHDSGTKQLTADMLPHVISYFRDQGYAFKNFYDINFY